MTDEELRIMCTDIAFQLRESQALESFVEELIWDADMIFNYIKHNVVPSENDISPSEN